MAKVIITSELENEISKVFKNQSIEILELFYTLKDNPKKGKEIGVVGGFLIKELKYKNYRFYFITDGYAVKFLKVEELNYLLIKFVRMSNKKDQKDVIEEIKKILRTIGGDGF